MSSNLVGQRQEFYRALMECISEVTDTPIGLYELHEGNVVEVIPETSRANYEGHCKLIQSFPGGKKMCEEDQLRRAQKSFRSSTKRSKELCWAGVDTQSVPIIVGPKPKALMVYGEMQLHAGDNAR